MINLLEIENYIKNFYGKYNPTENVYHSLNHVVDVVTAVQKISRYSQLSQSDVNLVTAAAWFHDIGHIEIWEGHEELSANYAKEYFQLSKVSEQEIKIITDCIKVTGLPHYPKNLLEEIICDADVSYIGSEYFFEKSNLLRLELVSRKSKIYGEPEWIQKNIDFVINSHFFTNYGKEIFEPVKRNNLELLYESLKIFSEK